MKKILYLLFILALAPQIVCAQVSDTTSVEEQQEEYVFNPACWMPVQWRIKRDINTNTFIYKGEFAVGIMASYMTLSTSNASLLTVLDDLEIEGSYASVTPYFGYFYRDNRYVGMRLSYNHIDGRINSATIDLGESNGISLDVPYVALKSDQYNVSVFHRSYMSLDRKNRLGLYAELEFCASKGITEFSYESSGVVNTTTNKSEGFNLKFNPGVAVFLFPNVCSTLSFGFGGLSYSEIVQYNEDNKATGRRTYSDFNLNFNVLDINFGMVFHLWRKKSKA
ncbi:MAG: hypothetical protein R3Y38_00210 [Rikenellaceae bacterium]